MKCNHVHKDAPINSICDDCFNRCVEITMTHIVLLAKKKKKGGKDDRKNNKLRRV